MELYGLKKIAGVEVMVLSDQTFELNVCILNLNKKKITIVNQQSGLKSFVEVKEFIGVNTPIAITIQGKNIIHKKIENLDLKTSDNILLQKAIPNNKLDDFNLQKFLIPSGVFLSIIRKNVLELILEDALKSKLWILGLYLGPFVIENLLPFLQSYIEEDKLSFQSSSLTVLKDQITDYKSINNLPTKDLLIGEDALPDKLLIAYSIAFQVLIIQNSKIVFNVPVISNQKKEWNQKFLFEKTGWGLLIGMLIALLINFLLFSNLSKKNQQLSEQVGLDSRLYNQMDTLSKQLILRKKIFQNTGMLGNSKLSFYADRLAASLPENIQFLELSINPVNDKKSKEEKKMVIEYDKILINGRCESPQYMNDWVRQIKLLDWVQSIHDESYHYDYRKKEGVFNFYILIKK